MSKQLETGGCLCGAVRYEASGEPLWTANCHCSDCRKATGGAFVPYAGYKKEAVKVTKGELVRFQSSPGVTRSFCGACGTPLFYEAKRWPDERHILIGTLDHPQRFAPRLNVYTKDQLPWLHLAGDIPSYETTTDGS